MKTDLTRKPLPRGEARLRIMRRAAREISGWRLEHARSRALTLISDISACRRACARSCRVIVSVPAEINSISRCCSRAFWRSCCFDSASHGPPRPDRPDELFASCYDRMQHQIRHHRCARVRKPVPACACVSVAVAETLGLRIVVCDESRLLVQLPRGGQRIIQTLTRSVFSLGRNATCGSKRPVRTRLRKGGGIPDEMPPS